MDDPLQMATEIMSLRAYAEAKHILAAATAPEDIPRGMEQSIEQVMQIQAQLIEEEKEQEHVGNS